VAVEGYWSQPQTTAPAVEPLVPATDTTPLATAAETEAVPNTNGIPQFLQDAVQARAKARALAS
jgi:hypothetical protein